MAAARLHRRKRVDALIRATARVRRLVSPSVDVTLEVLGSGPERGALERRIRKEGVVDAVRLVGEGGPDEVRALLGRGDAFVSPADQESFGIAALEALSSGLPVVARREGGVGTFVEDGVNGILVGSDEALVRALVSLARDDRRRNTLRRGASRGIPPAYTWDTLIGRHLALYEEVLARAPRGAGYLG